MRRMSTRKIADGDTSQLASAPAGQRADSLVRKRHGAKWAVVRLGTGRPAGTLFPVSLDQTGGAGRHGHQRRRRGPYDVTDALTGDSLASGVDPTASPHLHQRPSAGSIIPAKSGLAYYKPTRRWSGFRLRSGPTRGRATRGAKDGHTRKGRPPPQRQAGTPAIRQVRPVRPRREVPSLLRLQAPAEHLRGPPRDRLLRDRGLIANKFKLTAGGYGGTERVPERVPQHCNRYVDPDLAPSLWTAWCGGRCGTRRPA